MCPSKYVCALNAYALKSKGLYSLCMLNGVQQPPPISIENTTKLDIELLFRTFNWNALSMLTILSYKRNYCLLLLVFSNSMLVGGGGCVYWHKLIWQNDSEEKQTGMKLPSLASSLYTNNKWLIDRISYFISYLSMLVCAAFLYSLYYVKHLFLKSSKKRKGQYTITNIKTWMYHSQGVAIKAHFHLQPHAGW